MKSGTAAVGMFLFAALCGCSRQAEPAIDTLVVYEQYVDINGQKYPGSVEDALKAKYGAACPRAIWATGSDATAARQAEVTDVFSKRCNNAAVTVK